jgi:hypothetical protein
MNDVESGRHDVARKVRIRHGVNVVGNRRCHGRSRAAREIYSSSSHFYGSWKLEFSWECILFEVFLSDIITLLVYLLPAVTSGRRLTVYFILWQIRRSDWRVYLDQLCGPPPVLGSC